MSGEVVVHSVCRHCEGPISGIYGWSHDLTLSVRCPGLPHVASPEIGAPPLPRKPEDYNRDHPPFASLGGIPDVPQCDSDGFVKLQPQVQAQLDRIEAMLLVQIHVIESRYSMGGSVGVKCKCGWSFTWRWEDHRDQNWPNPEVVHAEHLKSLMPERTTNASTP